MSLVNYHTHCAYCDGRGEPEDYARAAVAAGFTALGFSSHAPLPFFSDWVMREGDLEGYLTEIRELAAAYRDRLEIYLGLEIDLVSGESGPSSPKFADLDLDYHIGSIHYVNGDRPDLRLTVDGPEEEFRENLEKNFGGDAERLVRRYYAHVRELADNHRFDILGHMDVVKLNNGENRYFDQDAEWYRGEVQDTLDAVRSNGCIVEVNTGAISRGRMLSVYPEPWIIRRCCEMGIPIQINADAHEPGMIGCYFEEARGIVRECGYREVKILIGGSWRTEEV